MDHPTFEVIIPNWNGKKLLRKNIPCVLKALEKVSALSKKLTVIDDGSTDDSISFLKQSHPEVYLLVNEKNLGFHPSVNRAASESDAEIILLLNSDMEPEPDAFQFLYNHFLTDSELFAVSGKIYSEDKTQFLYGNRGGIFRKGHFMLLEKAEEAS